MKTLDAAYKVLLESKTPLHYKELTQRMIARGYWDTDGKTPWDSVSARLSVDISTNGSSSRFARVEPGVYGLASKHISMRSDKVSEKGEDLKRLEESQIKKELTSKPLKKLINGKMSFTNAAEYVLRQQENQQPMHYRAFTEIALREGLISTKGLTPEATMYAQILSEISRRIKQGRQPRFVKHGGGFVGLASWEKVGIPYQIEQHNRKIRKQLRGQLQSMDPYDFEELIGRLLSVIGFDDVEVTKQSSDGGIDVRGTLVVADVIRTKMAVQVKRWKDNIHAPTVQQVRGSLGAHEQGLIITTSDFSRGARVEAERVDATPVALMGGKQLVDLLFEYELGVSRAEYNLFALDDSDNEL